jgi:hypothetical protein
MSMHEGSRQSTAQRTLCTKQPNWSAENHLSATCPTALASLAPQRGNYGGHGCEWAPATKIVKTKVAATVSKAVAIA